MDESRLSSIGLFESLSRDDRRLIAQHAEELEVDEGTHLVRQGEFAYEFFVLEDGSAEVVRDGERIAELGPGDFLGEMGIVSQAVRNATVRTTSLGTRHRHDVAGLPRHAAEQSHRREPDRGGGRRALPGTRRLT